MKIAHNLIQTTSQPFNIECSTQRRHYQRLVPFSLQTLTHSLTRVRPSTLVRYSACDGTNNNKLASCLFLQYSAPLFTLLSTLSVPPLYSCICSFPVSLAPNLPELRLFWLCFSVRKRFLLLASCKACLRERSGTAAAGKTHEQPTKCKLT